MKALDRLLFFLLALILLALCGGAIYMMLYPEQTEMLVGNFIHNVGQLWYLKVAVGAGIAVVLAMVIKVLFSRSGEGKHAEPKQIAISGDGNIRVTSAAVNEIVVHAAKSLEEVRDAQCKLSQTETGLNVLLTIFISGEQSIPETTEKTKNTVSETLENICGIIPASIRILVEKTPAVSHSVPATR